MVTNPEKNQLDTYFRMYERNPSPHASVERFVDFALEGEIVAVAENTIIKNYFQNILEETNLGIDTFRILRTMLVAGDAYALILRDNEGNVKHIRHLDPKKVEAILNEINNVERFEVDYGSKKETYLAKDIMHFRWKHQPDSPYGFSLLKGLEPLVEKEHKIMDEFLKAVHAQAIGERVDFDSESNLRVLNAIPYMYSQLTGVPIGIMNFKINNELEHKLQMNIFEKLCQELRDLLRNEITEKLIKPETTKKKFQETTKIYWKRKNRVTSQEVQTIMAELKLGLIKPDEARKRLGLTEYYV